MKVSIVIAAYNSAKYLPECLNSLINQTYENIEIICVNDGSTDNTLSILREYEKKDRRIKIYTKENEGKGAASARNLGLDHSTGDYVLVLDSDDFFEREMVEELISRAQKTDADVIIFTARQFEDDLQRKGEILLRPQLQFAPNKEVFSYKDCPKYICQIADFVAWNKFFKREFIEREQLRFDRIPISDDCYPSIIGTVLAKRISVINKPYVNYRIRTGASQTDAHAKHPEAAYKGAYSVVSKLIEKGLYEEVKQSYLNIALRVAQDYYDDMNDFKNLHFLHYTLLNEVFPKIGAEKLEADYFYDFRQWQWYELIHNNTPDEIVYKVMRSYGADMNTAILRFQFPKGVRRCEKVVLIGKGLAGRYWYAQNLLGKYCDIVCWVNSETDIPLGLRYDRILYAK